MKSLMAFTFFLFSFQVLSAQLSQVIHQTFDIDEAESVSLSLVGDLTIEKWAGNTIMTETAVELYDAKPSILKYFVNNGRYEIELDGKSTTVALRSKEKERRPIRTKKGECYEFVKVRVFVPEEFEIVNENSLVRSNPDLAEDN